MKKSDIITRLIIFDVIVLGSSGVCVFSNTNETTKIIGYVMFGFVVILLAIGNGLAYINNKIDNFNDDHGINR